MQVSFNPKDTQNFVKKALEYGEFAFDIETNSLDPFTGKILLMQFGLEDGTVYIFSEKLPKDILSLFNKLTVVGHNLKFDLSYLKQRLNVIPNKVYDVMIVEAIINMGKPMRVALDRVAERYLGIKLDKSIRDRFRGRENKVFSTEELDYAAKDVAILFDIKKQQLDRIKELRLQRVVDLENRTVLVSVDLELNGVLLNLEKWNGVLEEEEDALLEVCKNIYESLPEQPPLHFGLFDGRNEMIQSYLEAAQVNSNPKVKKTLRKLGFDLTKVDSFALKEIRDKSPFVKNLLDYRAAHKRIDTYLKPIPLQIHPITGRFHAQYTQLSMFNLGKVKSGAETGRYSCKYIHQIPADNRLRNCFIARPGHKLGTLDFGSQEIKIATNMSKDKSLLAFFEQEDFTDFHGYTASLVFGYPIEEVSKVVRNGVEIDPKYPKVRSKAKTTNFSLIYGITEFGLSKRLDVEQEEALDIINRYRENFPALMKMLDGWARFAEKNRYITDNSIGRIRYFDAGIPDWKIGRPAKNFPIQASAASQMKLALCRVREELGNRVKIISTVHDEGTFEIRDEDVEEVVPILKDIMVSSAMEIVPGPVLYDVSVKVENFWAK